MGVQGEVQLVVFKLALQHVSTTVSSFSCYFWNRLPHWCCCDPTRMCIAAPREVPLDTYRNIGIMAHIDAGKVCGQNMPIATSPCSYCLLCASSTGSFVIYWDCS